MLPPKIPRPNTPLDYALAIVVGLAFAALAAAFI